MKIAISFGIVSRCVRAWERVWYIEAEKESLKLWEIYVNILKYIILSRNYLFSLGSLFMFLKFYLMRRGWRISMVMVFLVLIILLYFLTYYFSVSVEREDSYEVLVLLWSLRSALRVHCYDIFYYLYYSNVWRRGVNDWSFIFAKFLMSGGCHGCPILTLLCQPQNRSDLELPTVDIS